MSFLHNGHFSFDGYEIIDDLTDLIRSFRLEFQLGQGRIQKVWLGEAWKRRGRAPKALVESIEEPKAPRVSPSHRGMGLGRRLCPLTRKFFDF